MGDDEDGWKPRRKSCGRHCEQARRLMRVSTLPLGDDTFEYNRNDQRKRILPTEQFLSNQKKRDESKKSSETESCDDEYMLQNLHKLKGFIRRVWNYAWCYTQYCYPGLRTAEYYKKVKRACQEKDKARKNEKKEKKKENNNKDKNKGDKKKLENRNMGVDPMYLANMGDASRALVSDSSTQTSDELDSDTDTSNCRKQLRVKPLKNVAKPLEEEPGWGRHAAKHLQKGGQAISNFISETDQEYQIGAIMKVLCLIIAPAVIWLGVNYIYLKKKYVILSGKLRRIKEENDILKKESAKLEMMLASTEKLKMPFSSKESRQQVVAEFTRLAESRMKSKKEITRLTTGKQALLEELKTAKKQRDVARNRLSSIAQGLLETNSIVRT